MRTRQVYERALQPLERSPDEHLREVRPVLAARTHVGGRHRVVGDTSGGVGRRGSAGERVLDTVRAQRRRPHARQPDVHASADAKAFLASLRTCTPSALADVAVSRDVLSELERRHRELIRTHLEKELKSTRVLREMRHRGQ